MKCSFENIVFGELVLGRNPRPAESISAEAIDEMAKSILKAGIIHPPSGKRRDDGKVEIFIGQRRYLGFARARDMRDAGMACEVDLEAMPVRVCEIDDRAAREQQVIENLQREQLHPRDEATGYKVLKDEYGYSVAQIAERIGKTDSYVFMRLSLLNVPLRMWRALDDGKVSVGHLEVVGAVPNEADRADFGKLILSGGEYGDRVMTVKEALETRSKRFVKSLLACGFDRADAALVAEEWKEGVRVMGGACVGCPYLAGSAKSPTCTNVRCLETKQNEVWRLTMANAEANGRRCMDAAQTVSIFHDEEGSYALRDTCDYIDLGARPGYQETGHFDDDGLKTWGEMLEGTGGIAQSIIARHWKTGKLHHILERDTAIELVEAQLPEGEASPFANRPGAPKAKKAKVEEAEGEGLRAKEGAEDETAREIGRIRAGWLTEAVMSVTQTSMPKVAAITMVRLALHLFLKAGGRTEVAAAIFGSKERLLTSSPTLEEEWAIYGAEAMKALELRPELWASYVAGLFVNVDGDAPGLQDAVGAVWLAAGLGIDVVALQSAAGAKVRGNGTEKGEGEETRDEMDVWAARIAAGEATYVDAIGSTPKKGTPEHKAWEAKRVKLVRRVKKIEAGGGD